MDPAPSEKRISELDGLRGLAILLVVFCHFVTGAIAEVEGGLARFIRSASVLSWSGVDLFFVLSGFLIGGILLDHRHARNYFKTFYVRRFCRIIPLYFVFLGILLFLQWFLARDSSAPWFNHLFRSDVPFGAYPTLTQLF